MLKLVLNSIQMCSKTWSKLATERKVNRCSDHSCKQKHTCAGAHIHALGCRSFVQGHLPNAQNAVVVVASVHKLRACLPWEGFCYQLQCTCANQPSCIWVVAGPSKAFVWHALGCRLFCDFQAIMQRGGLACRTACMIKHIMLIKELA